MTSGASIKNLLRCSAALFLAVALSACLAEVNTTKAEVRSIQQVSYQNQKKIRDLETSLAALNTEVTTLKGKAGDLPKEESVAALRNSQASLFTQVSDLLRELQVLNGRFDEYKHLMDGQLKKTTAEIDIIKSKLEGASPRGGGEDVTARLAAIEADIAFLKGKLQAMESGKKAVEEGLQPPTSELTPEVLYKKAYKAFEDNKYKESRQMMQELLERYPKHSLAGNARFWIGESFYAENMYEDAIISYEDVIQKYGDNPKVPAAMLKQAYAFLNLGDKKAARGILNELIRKYPKDSTAGAAKKKLQSID